MFLESTFFPFPSEVGNDSLDIWLMKEMHVIPAWFVGTFGSLAGATFNYYYATFGRNLTKKYGKYVGMLNDEKMSNLKRFLTNMEKFQPLIVAYHSGIRQYISLSAGLAKMNHFKFALFNLRG